jgi:hypothetical protein
MITPVSPINSQVSNYMALEPLVKAVVNINDSLPKSSLPTEVPGSVLSNTHLIDPPISLYTEHGHLAKIARLGTLIAYA